MMLFVLQNNDNKYVHCSGENEKRLVYDLFERNGYNPLIRPVVDVTDSLQINFSLALSQIISVVSFLNVFFLLVIQSKI